jgi:membrane protease YdiL (CAAX protease family)
MDSQALEIANLLFLIALFAGFGLFLSLAYLGERESAIKWLVYAVLLLVIAGLGLIGLMFAAFPALVRADPTVLETMVESLRRANIDLGPNFVPLLVSTIGWTGGAMAAISLAALLSLLPPVRRLIARVLPIDPARLVHTVALQYAAYLMVLSIVTLGAVNLLLALADQNEDLLATLGAGTTLTTLWAQAVGFVVIGVLGVGLLVRRNGAETLERLGLTRAFSWRWFLVVVLGGLVLGYVTDQMWRLMAPESLADVEKLSEALLGPVLHTGLIGALTIGISAGIGEEILFRGATQPRLGLIFTSLLFAAIHTQYTLSPALVQVFVLGLLLGLARQRANTTTAIAAHAAYNFTIAAIALWLPEIGP